MPLIPTHGKSKLSADFSYPIGSELLTSNLESVPQFSKLFLSFTDSTFPATKFRKTVLSDDKYYILDATFYPKSHFFDSWALGIYPVRRGLKKVARDALVSHGLPMLREWLANHDVTNPVSGVRCVLMFVPLEGYVYLREPKTGFERRPIIDKVSVTGVSPTLPEPQ